MTPTLVRDVHHVTAYDRWYCALAAGDKTYELRRLTRDYQRGDLLVVSNHDDPLAPPLAFIITHVFQGTGEYGLAAGWAVLSLVRVRK